MTVKVVLACATLLGVPLPICQAQLTPYTYNCPVQSGSNVSFTLSQYNGDVTNDDPKPAPIKTQTIPNNPVTGSFTATLWQDPTGAFKDVRMDHMNLYGPSTIPQNGGWTSWFTLGGLSSARAQIQSLHITEYAASTINQTSTPITSGAFAIPTYETQMYGNLAVQVGIGGFPITTINNDLSTHNTPPPQNSISGNISGSGSNATLSSTIQQMVYQYMDPLAQQYGLSCDYTMGVNFTSSITAVSSGAPVMQLFAEANSGYAAWPSKAVTLNSAGSFDPQGIGITSYAWDLNNDGTFETTGSSPTLTREQLAAAGLADGNHSVGLKVTDGDGYWATDIAQLAACPHCPGDANGDGQVTFEDFAALQNHYGQATGLWASGDFNFDGVVNFADFAALQNHYGRMDQVGMIGLTPEPISIGFWGLGILSIFLKRSRQ